MQKRALYIIWPGISYETALDKAALSTLSDRRAVSCIKFIGKVRPGNPLYPLIPNSVITISTISVCLRSGSSSRPMATRTERFSNFVRVKYKCINLVNKCSVLVKKKKHIYIYIYIDGKHIVLLFTCATIYIYIYIYISQLVRYPTIQSSDCKRDNKPMIWFDLERASCGLAYRTRNIIYLPVTSTLRSQRLMAFETRLFRFMAYRTRNVTFKARFFWLGILLFERASRAPNVNLKIKIPREQDDL